ncbi:MAG: glycoside-pentoside-hexuronide (GPH):cation symporter [Litorimonas sp.]
MSDAARLPTTSLTGRAKFGFGIADFGFNLYYTGLSLFLLYYYTDVLGIRPAVAGLIFAVPLFWDAVTDPVMGAIAGRVRSKLGRYRPFILFGTIPLALSFVMMFAAPVLFPGAVVLSAAIAHIVFRTAYTVVSIPYSSLMASLTRDSGERSSLAGVRMICATLGGLFTVFATLPLAGVLGGGDLARGFVSVAVLYAVLASALLLLTFRLTEEDPRALAAPLPDLRGSLPRLMRNRALLILFAAIVMASTAGAIFSKALIYYVKYVANIGLDVTTALIALTAAVSASIPFWMTVAKRLSKRNVWLAGAALSIAMQTVLLLAPPQSVTGFLTLLVAIGFGNGAFFIMFWSMLPDTVEYGQWKTGVRDEGVVFGINQFALKAAAGIGIGLLGFLLEAVGYVANEVQTQAASDGLRLISIAVPLAFWALAALIIAFYPLDKAAHARIVDEIDARDAKMDGGPLDT